MKILGESGFLREFRPMIVKHSIGELKQRGGPGFVRIVRYRSTPLFRACLNRPGCLRLRVTFVLFLSMA